MPVVASLDISELARLAGVSSRTIRYYGELGLVIPDGRGPGGRRLFSPDAVERLRFINRLKHLGMRLDDIGQLNAAFEKGNTPAMLNELDSLLEERLQDLTIRLSELESLSAELQTYRERIRSKRERFNNPTR